MNFAMPAPKPAAHVRLVDVARGGQRGLAVGQDLKRAAARGRPASAPAPGGVATSASAFTAPPLLANRSTGPAPSASMSRCRSSACSSGVDGLAGSVFCAALGAARVVGDDGAVGEVAGAAWRSRRRPSASRSAAGPARWWRRWAGRRRRAWRPGRQACGSSIWVGGHVLSSGAPPAQLRGGDARPRRGSRRSGRPPRSGPPPCPWPGPAPSPRRSGRRSRSTSASGRRRPPRCVTLAIVAAACRRSACRRRSRSRRGRRADAADRPRGSPSSRAAGRRSGPVMWYSTRPPGARSCVVKVAG